MRNAPGSTIVTFTPNGATSLLSTCENPSTAYFAVWYAPMPGVPPARPPIDENCRKCPLRCRRNTGRAAFVTLTRPNRFVSSWARKSASVVCSIAALFA